MTETTRPLRRAFLRVALCTSALLVASGLPGMARAGDAETRGREIAQHAYQSERGFGDFRVRMVMILRDRKGDETRRELEGWTLERPGGEDKSLVYFHSPRDIRGTALLTYSHPRGEDEQWLYLPALRRTKRISVSGRSSPFMGSEFAYEDLVATHVDHYGYRLLREDKLRGANCWVIERYPKYDGTGYKRQQVWIEKGEYRTLKIDYWDLRGRPLKTLSLGGYSKYLDKLWRPSEARMANQRTREVTLLRWYDYRFGSGLSESDFNRDDLGRAR